MIMKKIPLIAIVGPTATGKTSLSVELAKKIGGEIISADSMQIYKGLDIGTAKPNKDELLKVAHHMIDVCSPEIKFNVADYVKEAEKCIEDIIGLGKTPIICGGTGLYINSLIL